MMIPSLESVLAGIQSHALIRPEYYSAMQCDAALDLRDSHLQFDSDWSEVDNATMAPWNRISPDVQAQVEQIRKLSFLVVSQATQQHEIASYVSGDFELICKCRILGLEHPLVEHLWLAYQGGKFPLPSDYSIHLSNKS